MMKPHAGCRSMHRGFKPDRGQLRALVFAHWTSSLADDLVTPCPAAHAMARKYQDQFLSLMLA